MGMVNPFAVDGTWYKANLHTHTTVSDGDVSVEERVAQYRDQGYGVLAITDHEATSDVSALSTDDILVISGMETHPLCPDGPLYHLVCLNVPLGFRVDPDSDANTRIRQAKETGGEIIVAHPYWCGHTLKHLLPLEGYTGIEVYNSTCSKIGKAISSVHWDNLLDEGLIVPASACDDTHRGRDIFMGWTMLRLPELTTEAVLESLRTGCFYASCGPVIHDLREEEGVLTLECSPAAEVHFMCARSTGRAFYADEGEPITSATFAANPSARYVRVEVVDAQGRRAWSNPFVL